MRVLLISTYELGHQPLHLASPAGALAAAGHTVQCLDLAVDSFEPEILASIDLVAISVPMHTAMQLGIVLANRIKEEHPAMPIAFYGLYAAMPEELAFNELADAVIAGEYQEALVAWVSAGGGRVQTASVGKTKFSLPARAGLSDLDRYARLSIGAEHRVVGYVEASHGCRHRCRHCPVPVIYDGMFRIVGIADIVADVEQLVAAGAQHVTIGDPDFLNGPHHAKRVLGALHEQFPQLTFDVTIKVEHLLEHRDVLHYLAETGVVLIVSAFESTNDAILRILDKGHTAQDMVEAVMLVRSHGMELRPTWLPFTPWTSLGDMVDLFDFLALNDLIASVDPIQTTIRLLVPPGSLLIGEPAMEGHLGAYDPGTLGYPWFSPDVRLDELQRRMSHIVEGATTAGDSHETVMQRLWTSVLETAGRPYRELAIPQGATEGRPRLTEPWFC